MIGIVTDVNKDAKRRRARRRPPTAPAATGEEERARCALLPAEIVSTCPELRNRMLQVIKSSEKLSMKNRETVY